MQLGPVHLETGAKGSQMEMSMLDGAHTFLLVLHHRRHAAFLKHNTQLRIQCSLQESSSMKTYGTHKTGLHAKLGFLPVRLDDE